MNAWSLGRLPGSATRSGIFAISAPEAARNRPTATSTASVLREGRRHGDRRASSPAAAQSSNEGRGGGPRRRGDGGTCMSSIVGGVSASLGRWLGGASDRGVRCSRSGDALARRPPVRGRRPLVVDTFEDTYDGSCDDGDCSLRDAVAGAPDGATVSLPPGFYPLTITESGGGPADGALDVDRELSIVARRTDRRVRGRHRARRAGVRRPRGPDGAARPHGVRGDGRRGGARSRPTWTRRSRLDHVTLVGGRGGHAGQVVVAEDARLRAEDSLFLGRRPASTAPARSSSGAPQRWRRPRSPATAGRGAGRSRSRGAGCST